MFLFYLGKIISWYEGAPLTTKLFLILRLLTTPYSNISLTIKNKSDILDVGCSHGIFSGILADKSNNRQILAIDPSPDKIRVAQLLCKKYKNLRIKQSFINQLSKYKKYDIVLFIDVLYLLNYNEKIKILSQASKRLKKNGTVIVSTIDKSLSLNFIFTYLQEVIVVFITHLTYSSSNKLHFFDTNEFHQIAKAANIKIISECKLNKLFYYYRFYILKNNNL